MNKRNILLLSILLIFIFFLASVIFSLLNLTNNNILFNVGINHINVSKKSKEDATKIMNGLINKKLKKTIKLEYNEEKSNYEKTLDLSVLNIDYHLLDTINSAYNYGRSKNIFFNNFDIAKNIFRARNFKLNISYDEKMLDKLLADISSNLPNKMVQSGYYIDNNNLILTKGNSGLTVDKSAFKNELMNYLKDLVSTDEVLQIPVKNTEPNSIDLERIHSEVFKEPKDAYFKKEPFEVFAEIVGVDFDVKKAQSKLEKNPNKAELSIPLKLTQPQTTLKNLNIDVFPDELASFSTKYDPSNKDRSTNLEIAASKIDHTILAPGDEFSYNKIVGERSISAGYKEAKVYQGGQVVDGLGGGICQISSTLYNAVVLANLKVTERFNHQFVTSYVSPGRDATVAYGTKDFKFVNNRTYPIRIDISINSGIAKVDIHGIKEKKEYMIEIETEMVSNIPFKTVYETDSSLESGSEKIKQRGVNGVIVNAYKILKERGSTVSKELLSKDTYNALNRIISKN